MLQQLSLLTSAGAYRLQGYYFCGDGARRDEDGYIWITGRVDDVLNVSGHRVGTAEVENALTQHPLCAEAAVVGCARIVILRAVHCFSSWMRPVCSC